jgi:hypothetical protein
MVEVHIDYIRASGAIQVSEKQTPGVEVVAIRYCSSKWFSIGHNRGSANNQYAHHAPDNITEAATGHVGVRHLSCRSLK